MKLNLPLVLLVVLATSGALGEYAVAEPLDSLRFDSEFQDANSMTWPMLPGENLNDVARLFYPKNKHMQKQFVFKTLRLSAEVQPNLKASDRFETPTLLVIPTLKSLSNSTHAIKSGHAKPNKKMLRMSYDIEQIPAKLMHEYEALLTKNAFLKEELAKLNEKIVFLQAKLNDLKLILDKTLTLPSSGQLENSLPTSDSPAKKVFKNLNVNAAKLPAQADEKSSASDWLNGFDLNILLSVLGLGLASGLGIYLFNKYRRSVASNLSFVTTKVQSTVTDIGSYWQTTKTATVQNQTPGAKKQAKATKEAAVHLDSTLEEAKLLMSINRTSDAMAHLKMTIEAQPKASVNHWLYLLEIFRKLKLKDEFEKYATDMHQTFNVMTPTWEAVEIPMVVAQSLEEFPHIVEKLCAAWPTEAAGSCLRYLLTDNRGGERSGFGEEVVNEILMLIALLETRNSLD